MKISLPYSPEPKQYRAIIFATMKRLYLVAVVLVAISSGHSQLFVHARSVIVQESFLAHAKPSRRVITSALNLTAAHQLSKIAIESKRFIRPTVLPFAHAPTEPVTTNAQAVLQALNVYRQRNGKGALGWDSNLAAFAQQRANLFEHGGQLDNHAGFKDMLSHEGFIKFGFFQLGENSAIGQTVGATILIEEVYGKSPGHDANQLSDAFTHIGIGVSGTATDFVYGGKKK